MSAKSLADQLRQAADFIETHEAVAEQLTASFRLLFGQGPSGTGTSGTSNRAARPARSAAARPWHKVLGVPAHATETQIKAAYRRLAKRHHPDKGGDVKRFHEIQKAYESGLTKPF